MLQSLGLVAQNSVVITDLKYPNLNLKEKNLYYLIDVDDQRKTGETSLGEIIHLTKPTPLQLQTRLQTLAFDFWSHSLHSHVEDGIPLTIRFTKLSFSEKREAPGKVQGECGISVQFLWYRNFEAIKLTQYNAKSNYTRPEGKFNHEEFLTKMLGDALLYFDKWMTVNKGRNSNLVKGVKLVLLDDQGRPDSDTVFYAVDRPLRYDDFKAQPKMGRYAAMVFTSISYEGNSRVVDNFLEVVINLKVYVVKSMSWMKADSKNPRVLKHEQTHFDIAKIAAERFKRQIRSLDLTVEDHDSQIQYQFLETYREMHNIQKAYDHETQHGLNLEAQRKWEEMVSNELQGISEIKI